MTVNQPDLGIFSVLSYRHVRTFRARLRFTCLLSARLLCSAVLRACLVCCAGLLSAVLSALRSAVSCVLCFTQSSFHAMNSMNNYFEVIIHTEH